MMRKRTSLRRWKARFEAGRFIPYFAAMEMPRLMRWLKSRANAYCPLNRDGWVK